MRTTIIILMAIALAGCATSETVYLKNPSNHTVQCGPFTDYGRVSDANATTEAQPSRLHLRLSAPGI